MTNTLIHLLLMLFMPPLLFGVIGKTKAAFSGRVGAPYLQPYHDLFRLWRKGAVFSSSTTFLFRAGPIVSLAAIVTAGLLIPLGSHLPPLSFTGDMIFFAYLLALARFFTMAAALDTGSSFEGMGAAREASFACLAEPTLFFALVVLARLSGSLTLSSMLTGSFSRSWDTTGAAIVLLVAALFVVLLVENCRIPFDDPTTHLELTMIHEVMVLDHSGPLFGFIQYGATLKLFILGAFFLNIALPFSCCNDMANWLFFIAAMLALAISIGVIESVMARLRLLRIPQLLVAATILAAFALVLILS
ncbi:MAG TPA: NADH-quinone oxidoreductase subunit H [Geobacterales bacterium]|nr:NADH-quinone oxidoreductase subunit H [Geobacterales bacterium]